MSRKEWHSKKFESFLPIFTLNLVEKIFLIFSRKILSYFRSNKFLKMVSTSSGAGAQISVLRCEGQNELVGMIPATDAHHNRLALSSFQAEMPNQVQTTNKPVVLMVAPERKMNGQGTEELGIGMDKINLEKK